MSAKSPTSCDPGLLRGYLDQDLAAGDARWLEEHLDECAACRTRITQQAAAADDWDSASRYLRADHWDSQSSPRPDSSSRELHEHESAHEEHDGVSEEVLLRLIKQWLGPSDDPRYIGRFGGYEVLGLIGQGGMGVVLKGYEPPLNRYVAIKLLAPVLASSGAARKRFAREAQAAAAVLHENVIAIHRVDEAGGLPFLVMPYSPGVSLQKRIDDEGPLPLAAILRIGRQIASGLAAAHAQGLVHRDIKPANILLEPGVERVTITDFGLARAADDGSVTRTGMIAGTPQYMSPEQSRGEPIDARSDLFSLGSVLYAMCTGHPPFRAETGYGVLRRITDDEPRSVREINTDIPSWFEAILRRLLAKSPAGRFESAAVVAELLERCLAHLQQPTTVPLPRELHESDRDDATGRMAPWWKGAAGRWSALVAAVVLVVVGLTQLGGRDDRSTWDRSKSTSTEDGDGAPPTPGNATEDGAAPSTAWDDGELSELHLLGRDLDSLERQATRLWGDQRDDRSETGPDDSAVTEPTLPSSTPVPGEETEE